MKEPNLEKQSLTCAQARWIDMVDYLSGLGHEPQKIKGQDYWYLSPLREEKSASFKVNRKLNLWFDHGTGKGGTLIDFGIAFHGCSISAFLQKLTVQKGASFSFHPHQNLPLKEEGIRSENNLQILATKPLQNALLLSYLEERKISLPLARRYTCEVDHQVQGKQFTAIGFANSSGGYELRSPNFKGCSAPKDTTYLQNKGSAIAVFEGFFSFLSYLTLLEKQERKNLLSPRYEPPSFLILNSLSFLEKSRQKMEQHDKIHLYLDRDAAGLKATQTALRWSEKYRDQSHFYKHAKDLNEHLIHCYKPDQQLRHAKGRHL